MKRLRTLSVTSLVVAVLLTACGDEQTSLSVPPPLSMSDLTLAIGVTPAGCGTTVPEAGKYSQAAGSPVSLEAAAALGYRFVQWKTEGGVTLSSTETETTTATLSQDGKATAVFRKNPVSSLVVSPEGSGFTEPKEGSNLAAPPTDWIAVAATPRPGYDFVRWRAGNSSKIEVRDATAASTEVRLSGNTVLTAEFATSAVSFDGIITASASREAPHDPPSWTVSLAWGEAQSQSTPPQQMTYLVYAGADAEPEKLISPANLKLEGAGIFSCDFPVQGERDAIHTLVVARDAAGATNQDHHPCQIPLPEEVATLKSGVRDIEKMAGAENYTASDMFIRMKGDFLDQLKQGDTALYDMEDGFATAHVITGLWLDTFNGETETIVELELYPVQYLSDIYKTGGFSANFHLPGSIPATSLGCPVELLPQRWRAFAEDEARAGRAVYAHPDGKYILSTLSSMAGGILDIDLGKAGKLTGSYYCYFDWLIDSSFRKRHLFLYTVDESKLKLNVDIDYADAYHASDSMDLIQSEIYTTLSIGVKKWMVSMWYSLPFGYSIHAEANTKMQQKIAHHHLRNMKFGWSSSKGWEETVLLDETDPPVLIPSAKPAEGVGGLSVDVSFHPIMNAYIERRVFLMASSDARVKLAARVRLQPPDPIQLQRLETAFDLQTSVQLDPFRQFHEKISALRFDWRIPEPYREVLGLPAILLRADSHNPNEVDQVNSLHLYWEDGVRNPVSPANLSLTATLQPDRAGGSVSEAPAPYILRRGRVQCVQKDPLVWEQLCQFIPKAPGRWTIHVTGYGSTIGPLGWKEDIVTFDVWPKPQ